MTAYSTTPYCLRAKSSKRTRTLLSLMPVWSTCPVRGDAKDYVSDNFGAAAATAALNNLTRATSDEAVPRRQACGGGAGAGLRFLCGKAVD